MYDSILCTSCGVDLTVSTYSGAQAFLRTNHLTKTKLCIYQSHVLQLGSVSAPVSKSCRKIDDALRTITSFQAGFEQWGARLQKMPSIFKWRIYLERISSCLERLMNSWNFEFRIFNPTWWCKLSLISICTTATWVSCCVSGTTSSLTSVYRDWWQKPSFRVTISQQVPPEAHIAASVQDDTNYSSRPSKHLRFRKMHRHLSGWRLKINGLDWATAERLYDKMLVSKW